MRDSEGIRWLGPLAFTGIQFGLLLGFWFVAWLAAMIAHRPWKEADAGKRYLWWLSAPMFTVFLLFSFKTAEEPNWPVTTYISGLVLAIGWIARQLQAPRPVFRRLTVASLGTACVLGLMVAAFMHQSVWVQPVLLRISGPMTAKRPTPLRTYDPTCRLRGWRTLAADVDRIRDELQHEEPLIAGYNWSIPGELGFYCKDHPTVYSLGPAVGDRFSQYDLWSPNPVWDADEFKGKTFIFVGDIHGALYGAFEQVEEGHTVVYYERGQPVAQWHVTVCRGFRGFPNLPGWLQGKQF